MMIDAIPDTREQLPRRNTPDRKARKPTNAHAAEQTASAEVKLSDLACFLSYTASAVPDDSIAVDAQAMASGPTP